MLISLMVFLNSGGRTVPLGARPNGSDNAVERTKIGWTSIGKFLMQKSSSAGGPIPPERVIHVELKRLGAWNGRTHCPYCGCEHQDKFDLLKCGGKAGLASLHRATICSYGFINCTLAIPPWATFSRSHVGLNLSFNTPHYSMKAISEVWDEDTGDSRAAQGFSTLLEHVWAGMVMR
ncbi:hypothetical protein K438DRAFT_1763978 [Mycena galopus ATCC 62051]|nr:hypothetical protein K438DRAFT_1763978 [Mycena galopus ATCC 62051]